MKRLGGRQDVWPKSSLPAATMFVILLAFLAHTYVFSLDRIIALNGFSILEVLEAHTNPEAFIRDFPGGARVTTAFSPTVYIYFLFHDLFGINSLILNYVMIFLEISFIVGGAYILWKTLAQSAEHVQSLPIVLKYGFFVCLLLVLLVSDAQRPNLASMGFPFFHGQFYGFADGLRLAGLAFVLKRRWTAAGILFTICFMIHPIKAVIGLAFAIPIIFLDWRSALNWQSVLSGMVTCSIIIVWYIFFLSSDKTNGVPLQDFTDYTRTLQYHWYPVDRGFLGSRHETYLSPFMAIVLMSFVALGHTQWPKALRLKIALGILALVILTAVGIWVSVDLTSTALIRVCLIRASTLITLLAPFIILAAAMQCWQNDRWFFVAAYLSFLGIAFLSRGALAPAFAILLAILAFRKCDKLDMFTLVLAVTVLLTSFWLWQTYPNTKDPISAALPLMIVTCGLWLTIQVLSKPFARRSILLENMRLSMCAITITYFLAGTFWTVDRLDRMKSTSEVADAYLETQLWARKNTVSGSLFMVDPCRWYGWRDFSSRASIGTVREWFMTAWVYTDDASQLEKGKQIASALGFDMEPFRASPNLRWKLCKSAWDAYYRSDMRGQKVIAKHFGVDYFVFEKAHALDSLNHYEGSLDFENKHFAVLAAEKIE